MESTNAGWVSLAREIRKLRKRNQTSNYEGFSVGQIIMLHGKKWEIIEITKDVDDWYYAVLEMVDFGGPRERVQIDYLLEVLK